MFFARSSLAKAAVTLLSVLQASTTWASPIEARSTASSATLVAVIPLQSGVQVPPAASATSSECGKLLRDIAHIDGVSAAYYSREVEDPTKLDVIAVFDSDSEALLVQQALVSGKLSPAISQVANGSITAEIVNTNPPESNLASSPVTEIATFWLLPNATQATVDGFSKAFANLGHTATQYPGNKFVTYGFTQGTTANPSGQQCITAVAFVGWASVAAHTAFANSPQFAAAVAQVEPYISATVDHNDMLVKVV